jgi:hypothetical protein
MTQEQKDLLMNDLCSRLPYGVKCSFGVDDAIYEVCGVNPTCCGASEIQATHIKSSINGDFSLSSCKPYLLPLSSMTAEQKREYARVVVMSGNIATTRLAGMTVQDWFSKNHFDYRGLIPMGLANDATNKNIY